MARDRGGCEKRRTGPYLMVNTPKINEDKVPHVTTILGPKLRFEHDQHLLARCALLLSFSGSRVGGVPRQCCCRRGLGGLRGRHLGWEGARKGMNCSPKNGFLHQAHRTNPSAPVAQHAPRFWSTLMLPCRDKTRIMSLPFNDWSLLSRGVIHSCGLAALAADPVGVPLGEGRWGSTQVNVARKVPLCKAQPPASMPPPQSAPMAMSLKVRCATPPALPGCVPLKKKKTCVLEAERLLPRRCLDRSEDPRQPETVESTPPRVRRRAKSQSPRL